jgi:hypothetical protein
MEMQTKVRGTGQYAIITRATHENCAEESRSYRSRQRNP